MNGHSNGANGTHHAQRLRPGVFAPIPAFFLPGSEDLDIPTFEQHVLRVARAGVGLVISGSMGEGHHLSSTERAALLRAARRTLDSAEPPLQDTPPIIAGAGAGSTRETIRLSREAAQEGADATIVICSGYFAGALDKAALQEFWEEIAQASPIPVMIYNYPGAAGGLDLDSSIIEALAASSPNICGVKLTCGNVGKLTRIATHPAVTARNPPETPFLVLGGFVDFLLPAMAAGAHGSITGLANLAPTAVAQLYKLSVQALADPSVLPQARALQGVLAHADRTVALAGIAGTKYLLEKLYGYGGLPRKPLRGIDRADGEKLWEHPDVRALVDIEWELAGKRVS